MANILFPVVLAEIDYRYQSSGAPAIRTLRIATKFYTDGTNSPALRYREALDAKAPLYFSRSLSGPTLGSYSSSFGSLEINNENGEYDFLLRVALDNSEVRVYLGDLRWQFSEFQLLFTALAVKADATSTARVSVLLKDSSALLNRSIGGEVLVGGTASSADKFRPANVGLVFQVPCEVLDPVTLRYVHSDRGGVEGTAVQLYDRGIEVAFTDGGDGTAQLDFPPDGQVTADVLATTPANPGLHRISDIFYQIVADRCGLQALGKYTGANATFVVGDADDYPAGLSILSAKNVARELLPQVAESGNCFWAISRLGNFFFGRLKPQDIESLGITPVKIRKDDIENGTLKATKLSDPLYYRLQCYVNKNWFVASDIAAAVDQDRQNLLRSDGLVLQQEEAEGISYADSPELYDKSLAVSPVLPTLLSAAVTDFPDPSTVAQTWMEYQRFMYLPWLEGISFRCGLEFFELELGDVVELTVDRFGCDAGVLMQVAAISLQPVLSKMELTLVRRLTPVAIAEDWTRVTEPSNLSFQGAPLVKPPVLPPPPGVPPIFSFPDQYGGLGDRCSIGDPYTDRVLDTNDDYIPGGATDETYEGDISRRLAFTSDGKYLVVGKPAHDAGSGNYGEVRVLKRSGGAGGTYSLVATLSCPTTPFFAFGHAVSISDDLKIVVGDRFDSKWYSFEPFGTDAWATGDQHSTPNDINHIKISRDGQVVAVSCWETIQLYTWSGAINPANNTPELTATGDFGGIALTFYNNGYRLATFDEHINCTVQVWTSNDGDQWNMDQSLVIGATDNIGGVGIHGNVMGEVAMSLDGRVICVGTDDVFRSSRFVGGVYILQAIGTALSPLVGTYAVSALITGPITVGTNTNYGFGCTLALSDDGQFLAVGATFLRGLPGPDVNVTSSTKVNPYLGFPAETQVTIVHDDVLFGEVLTGQIVDLVTTNDPGLWDVEFPVDSTHFTYAHTGSVTVPTTGFYRKLAVEGGRAFGVNRIQALHGEWAIEDLFASVSNPTFEFRNPYLYTSDVHFGSAIAMNSNGGIVAIGNSDLIGSRGNGVDSFEQFNNQLTTLRVFDQTLDDIPNDYFDNAVALSPTVFGHEDHILGSPIRSTTPIKNLSASMEPDEPVPSGYEGIAYRSLWYKVTPDVDALLDIDTLLSLTALDPFYRSGPSEQMRRDTVLQIYEGSSLNTLTPVSGGFNDDAGTTPCNMRLNKLVEVPVVGGTTYQIQVLWKAFYTAVAVKLRYVMWRPPEPTGPFFLDNFNGPAVSGLTGRTPDIGNNWGDYSAWPADIIANGIGDTPDALDGGEMDAHHAIDGSGNMGQPTSGDSGYRIKFPYTLPVVPWYFEWEFVLRGLDTDSFGEVLNMDLFFYATDGSQVGFHDFQLKYFGNYESGPGVFDPAYEIGWSGPWSQIPPPFLSRVTSVLPADGTHVLRIEFLSNHQGSVSIDGVLIATIFGDGGFDSDTDWNAYRWVPAVNTVYFGDYSSTYSVIDDSQFVVSRVEMGVVTPAS